MADFPPSRWRLSPSSTVCQRSGSRATVSSRYLAACAPPAEIDKELVGHVEVEAAEAEVKLGGVLSRVARPPVYLGDHSSAARQVHSRRGADGGS